MWPILFSIMAASALFAAQTAKAQPSYDCGAQLNAAEQAICGSPELSRLDRDMVARFYRIYNQLEGDRALAFRREQSQWRRDRDACGVAVGCIKANYVYRLGQFAEITGGSPASSTGPARSPTATVLANGTIERRMADGSVVRHLPDGSVERYAADGTKLPSYAYSQVQHADLPPLPPLLQQWGAALEGSLALILTNILTDDEHSAYQATEAGKAGYVLIDWRLRSIAILTQP